MRGGSVVRGGWRRTPCIQFGVVPDLVQVGEPSSPEGGFDRYRERQPRQWARDPAAGAPTVRREAEPAREVAGGGRQTADASTGQTWETFRARTVNGRQNLTGPAEPERPTGAGSGSGWEGEGVVGSAPRGFGQVQNSMPDLT
jgi:hypothetical protein